MRGLGELIVSDMDRVFLHEEIHLMRRAPDAQNLVEGLLRHQRDEPADTARNRVLNAQAYRHQNEPQIKTQMVKTLAEHLSDVHGRVKLVERVADYMHVVQNAPDADTDAKVEEGYALMSDPVAGERERSDVVVAQDVRQDLQVGLDDDADLLADFVIVEAGVFGVAERILLLPDHARSLFERHPELCVLQDQIVQERVADLGNVRPVRMLVEQFQGVLICDRVHVRFVLVQIRIEENVADDALDDSLRDGDGQRRLRRIHVPVHGLMEELLGGEVRLLVGDAEGLVIFELLRIMLAGVLGEVVLEKR